MNDLGLVFLLSEFGTLRAKPIAEAVPTYKKRGIL